MLRDGFSKRRLASAEPDYLDRFARETSRAEFGHWLTWALALTFFLWTPWQMGLFMVVYGGLINVPFILIQRYNRARLRRFIARSARRTARAD
jgi:glycosyl-4,4'-diaponeurosporenoate acyltransferase